LVVELDLVGRLDPDERLGLVGGVVDLLGVAGRGVGVEGAVDDQERGGGDEAGVGHGVELEEVVDRLDGHLVDPVRGDLALAAGVEVVRFVHERQRGALGCGRGRERLMDAGCCGAQVG
jgi:hypothetical protein